MAVLCLPTESHTWSPVWSAPCGPQVAVKSQQSRNRPLFPSLPFLLTFSWKSRHCCSRVTYLHVPSSRTSSRSCVSRLRSSKEWSVLVWVAALYVDRRHARFGDGQRRCAPQPPSPGPDCCPLQALQNFGKSFRKIKKKRENAFPAKTWKTFQKSDKWNKIE